MAEGATLVAVLQFEHEDEQAVGAVH